MDILFTHKLAVLTKSGSCSPILHGMLRKDETAAIFPPEHEPELNYAHKVRHYRDALDIRDYVIIECHRDNERPLGKYLIRPIVCTLSIPHLQASE